MVNADSTPEEWVKENTDLWIAVFGDDAYWEAVRSTVVSVKLGNTDEARQFGALAVELTRRGYHKRRRVSAEFASGVNA